MEDQDDFLNAVAVIQANEDPEAIFEHMKLIEKELQKDPPFRFGPRTIDLDLLLIENEIVETNELLVPHARMHERRFVLEPLCELIDPESEHPLLNETWEALLFKVQDQECEKVSSEL